MGQEEDLIKNSAWEEQGQQGQNKPTEQTALRDVVNSAHLGART